MKSVTVRVYLPIEGISRSHIASLMLTSIVLRRSFPPVTPYIDKFFQVLDGVSGECGCAVTPEDCRAVGVIRRRANSGDTIQSHMEAGSAPILPFDHAVC